MVKTGTEAERGENEVPWATLTHFQGLIANQDSEFLAEGDELYNTEPYHCTHKAEVNELTDEQIRHQELLSTAQDLLLLYPSYEHR